MYPGPGTAIQGFDFEYSVSTRQALCTHCASLDSSVRSTAVDSLRVQFFVRAKYCAHYLAPTSYGYTKRRENLCCRPNATPNLNHNPNPSHPYPYLHSTRRLRRGLPWFTVAVGCWRQKMYTSLARTLLFHRLSTSYNG